MTLTEARRLFHLIAELSEKKGEVDLKILKEHAEKEGIVQVEEKIQDLVSRGLLTEENSTISIIAKRLFW